MNCMSPATRDGKKRQPKTTPARLRRRLEAKLLSLGGSRVVWQGDDPQATLIAVRGQLFPQRVRMRRGEPHRCHANAADLWARAADKYQLVTGYALSGDRWVSHSWVVDGKSLYETTRRYGRYFGAVLPPLLANKFWFENFFDPYYPDYETPPGFWEDRLGLVALAEQMRQLPRDEFFRLMTAYSRGRCA